MIPKTKYMYLNQTLHCVPGLFSTLPFLFRIMPFLSSNGKHGSMGILLYPMLLKTYQSKIHNHSKKIDIPSHIVNFSYYCIMGKRFSPIHTECLLSLRLPWLFYWQDHLPKDKKQVLYFFIQIRIFFKYHLWESSVYEYKTYTNFQPVVHWCRIWPLWPCPLSRWPQQGWVWTWAPIPLRPGPTAGS